jgi:hypothetical protein
LADPTCRRRFCAGNARIPRVGNGSSDPLEEVIAPGYFTLERGLLRPGELIYVHVHPHRGRGNGVEAVAPQMALVMVGPAESDPEAAGGSVRLVQDFGHPARSGGLGSAPPALVAAPVKRGRGRLTAALRSQNLPEGRTRPPPSH